MTYYIKSPAHFCKGSNSYSTIDIIVDIENGRIELVSEDKKNIIRLDLIGVNELGDTLQKITDSKRFQTALLRIELNQAGLFNDCCGNSR